MALPQSASQSRRLATTPGRSVVPWVLAAVVVLTLFGLLTAQLVLLRAQLRHVSSQDKTSRVLLTRADPALAPLPATLRQLTPALQTLRASHPVQSARLARALAVQSAPVLSSLGAADLPTLFSQVRALVAAALNQNRLATSLDAATNFFAAVRGANLIEPLASAAARLPPALADVQSVLSKVPGGLRTLRASRRIQARSLTVQQQSLAVQLQTLALLQRSFAVQQELLVHARSLDSKVP